MGTMALLWELLRDRTARRVLLLVAIVFVPLAVLVPSAIAPGLGTAGGSGALLALLVLSACSAGVLMLGSSVAVAAVTIRLQGLSWRELGSRTLAAAIGGVLGLVGVGGVLAPALAIAFAATPVLRWPVAALCLMGGGWLAMLAAVSADVGPAGAARAILGLWRQRALAVTLRLAVLALVLAAALAALARLGLQETIAVWLAAAVICLAPAGAGIVWQAQRRLVDRTLALRTLRREGGDMTGWAAAVLRDWIVVEEQEEATSEAKPPSRRTAVSGGGRFGSRA